MHICGLHICGGPFFVFIVLYVLVVLSCKIAEVGFGWWAAAMIGLIVITTDPPQAPHYQCHMSFKSKLNLATKKTTTPHPPSPFNAMYAQDPARTP